MKKRPDKLKMRGISMWNYYTLIICLIFLAVLLPVSAGYAQEKAPEPPKTALLIIDVQYFYYPGGSYELVNPEAASLNAQKVLKAFRAKKETVIHVRHNAKKHADIHEHVKPVPGEKVITKNYANSFKETDLLKYLRDNGIQRLVICGMMTHMCVEAATRAASDYGFKCVVIHDACATRNLIFQGKTVKAEDVHLSTLRTLSGGYARVIDTGTFLKTF
jgi:nicotinamidase-related amidase